MLQIIDSLPCDCKICGGSSPLYGVVDFQKSCPELQGQSLALSGTPVYYRRCGDCGFLFTTAFDDWSSEAFLKYIYNNEYVLVDPDYVEGRPINNAKVVAQTFHASRESLSILDYGGGNGLLTRTLAVQGFRASTYDPLTEFTARPQGRFDLITCFEVMEHVPSPAQIVADIASLLNDEGALLFTTLTQPAVFDQLGLRWWYVAPRNGHISLYSRRALTILFEKNGMSLMSLTDLVHFAFRKLPAFAAHLVVNGRL